MKKIILISIPATFFLIIFCIPYILSSSWGVKILKNSLKNNKIEIQSLSLRWLGPQTIKNLSYTTENADVSVGALTTEMSLIQLFETKNFDLDALFDHPSQFSISQGSLVLKNENYPQIILKDICGNFTKKNKKDAVTFSLTAKTSQDHHTGSIEIKGNMQQNSITSEYSLDNIPTPLFDAWAKKKNFSQTFTLSELFGPLFSAHGTVSKNHKEVGITNYLSSDSFKAEFDALYKEDLLTLKKPLKASFSLSRNISAKFLKDVNPLFFSVLTSQRPAEMQISNEGFFLKFPLSLKNIQMEYALIDMGKMKAENKDTLALIMGLLTTQSSQKVPQMEIWCTPMQFSLKEGKFHADRMDALLAGNIHVCTWGEIDLIKDKVDMTLGLTASALKRGFGITSVPEDFVLHIPMKGSTKNVKIDKKRAATQISALIADSATSTEGKIVAEVLKVFRKKYEQPETPSAQFPFPWERN